VDAVTEQLKTLKVGDALEAGIEMGPVVEQQQLEQEITSRRRRSWTRTTG
jgi:alpha-ketoglutaric semialdehyde dehydrogenase